MGYSPKIWGKEGWHFIHMVALNYPFNPTEEVKNNYSEFFHSLQHVLPCEFCSISWAEKIKENPPNLKSRKELFDWTVDMHNLVNVSNKKSTISYDAALRKINNKKSSENLKESFIITSAIFLSAIAIKNIFQK
jgi:hypothetical protein